MVGTCNCSPYSEKELESQRKIGAKPVKNDNYRPMEVWTTGQPCKPKGFSQSRESRSFSFPMMFQVEESAGDKGKKATKKLTLRKPKAISGKAAWFEGH